MNGGNTDLRIGGDVTGRQPLDIVQFGKFPVVVVRLVGHELLLGLFAEVFGIHQKKDALGIGMFEQSVNESAGGIGLPSPGGHLDEGFRFVPFERIFQIFHRHNLSGAQPGLIQFREMLESLAQAIALFQPFGKSFWLEKMEDTAAPWLGVTVVGEAGDSARTFKDKGERVVVEVFEFGRGISG